MDRLHSISTSSRCLGPFFGSFLEKLLCINILHMRVTVAEAMRLAIDGLHGATETSKDEEVDDVGEAVVKHVSAQLEVTEGGHGVRMLGKPYEVHANE